jgi:hypothetical protein
LYFAESNTENNTFAESNIEDFTVHRYGAWNLSKYIRRNVNQHRYNENEDMPYSEIK